MILEPDSQFNFKKTSEYYQTYLKVYGHWHEDESFEILDEAKEYCNWLAKNDRMSADDIKVLKVTITQEIVNFSEVQQCD